MNKKTKRKKKVFSLFCLLLLRYINLLITFWAIFQYFSE